MKKRLRSYLLDPFSIWSMVGFATYWAWATSSFYSLNLYQLYPSPIDYMQSAQIADLLAGTLSTFILVVFLPKLTRLFSKGRKPFLIVSAVASLGTALAGFSFWSGSVIWLLYVGAALAGAAMGIVILLWAQEYSNDSQGRGAVWVCGAMVMGMVIYLLISNLQPYAAIVTVVLLPFIGGLIFFLLPKSSKAPENDKREVVLTSSPLKAITSIPWRLTVGLITYTLAFAVMQNLYAPVDTDSFSMTANIQLLGRFFVALVMFAGFALFNWKPHIAYRVGLLFMLAGFLLILFFHQTQSAFTGILSLATVMMGYTCFYLMIWHVVLQIANTSKEPMIRVFGSAQLVINFGILLGLCMGLLLRGLPDDVLLLSGVVSVLIYALVAVWSYPVSPNKDRFGFTLKDEILKKRRKISKVTAAR